MSDNKQQQKTQKPPTPDISVRTMKPEEREKFWAKKKKDNLNNPNLSRGAIGYVANPQGAKTTEGTLHDVVLPPSRSAATADRNRKEVSEEEMQERINREREAGVQKKRISEETAKKLRTEMQGFKYTPPEDLKDVPFLVDNTNDGDNGTGKEDVSQKQTSEEQGEEIILEQEGEGEEEDSSSQ